jgi:hypothetical protein
MDRLALVDAYRACHFEVRRLNGGARDALRIGAPLPAAVADWLGDSPLCAFITAYNPQSTAQPAQDNRRAQRELLRQLRDHGARWRPGVGRIPGQPWREPSLLVAGLDLDAIDGLAWRHSQNAVVLAHRNAPAKLRLYGAEWNALANAATQVVAR